MGFLVGEIKKVDSAIFKAPENELAKKTAALANERRKQAESKFRRQTARVRAAASEAWGERVEQSRMTPPPATELISPRDLVASRNSTTLRLGRTASPATWRAAPKLAVSSGFQPQHSPPAHARPAPQRREGGGMVTVSASNPSPKGRSPLKIHKGGIAKRYDAPAPTAATVIIKSPRLETAALPPPSPSTGAPSHRPPPMAPAAAAEMPAAAPLPMPSNGLSADVKLGLRLLEQLHAKATTTEAATMPIRPDSRRLPAVERGVSLAFVHSLCRFYASHGTTHVGVEAVCSREGFALSLSELTAHTGLSLVESLLLLAQKEGKDASCLFGRVTTHVAYASTGTTLAEIGAACERGVSSLKRAEGFKGTSRRYLWLDICGLSQNVLCGRYEVGGGSGMDGSLGYNAFGGGGGGAVFLTQAEGPSPQQPLHAARMPREDVMHRREQEDRWKADAPSRSKELTSCLAEQGPVVACLETILVLSPLLGEWHANLGDPFLRPEAHKLREYPRGPWRRAGPRSMTRAGCLAELGLQLRRNPKPPPPREPTPEPEEPEPETLAELREVRQGEAGDGGAGGAGGADGSFVSASSKRAAQVKVLERTRKRVLGTAFGGWASVVAEAKAERAEAARRAETAELGGQLEAEPAEAEARAEVKFAGAGAAESEPSVVARPPLKLVVVLRPDERRNFQLPPRTSLEAARSIVSTIDVRDSQMPGPEPLDRDLLWRCVERSGGPDELNRMVRTALLDWLGTIRSKDERVRPPTPSFGPSEYDYHYVDL